MAREGLFHRTGHTIAGLVLTFYDEERRAQGHRRGGLAAAMASINSKRPLPPPDEGGDMKKKLRYGKLNQDAQTGGWTITTLDGEIFPVRVGDRVNVGTIFGIPVYAMLVSSGGTSCWAVTEYPDKPYNGAYASFWTCETEKDAGASFAPSC